LRVIESNVGSSTKTKWNCRNKSTSHRDHSTRGEHLGGGFERTGLAQTGGRRGAGIGCHPYSGFVSRGRSEGGYFLLSKARTSFGRVDS